jgi:ankyrin repeat protein
MSKAIQFREYIENGNFAGLKCFLQKHPEYSNRKVKWQLNQENESDPLHYVSDCVFNGWLTSRNEAEITKLLLNHGANIDGNEGAESPLIGSTSLSVDNVSEVLIEAGANIDLVSVFGANALHWAAYVGTPNVVDSLLKKGAPIETKCSEFNATPLFWAVQGFSKYGQKVKNEQVAAARVLIDAGADVHTENIEKITALRRSKECESSAMEVLLRASGAH